MNKLWRIKKHSEEKKMRELLRWNKINLRILAKVKPNGRISTKGKTLVIEKDSYLQGIWRFIHSESRSEAVETIKSIVQVAIELSKCIISQKIFVDFLEGKDLSGAHLLEFKMKCRQLSDIACDMEACTEGIENLLIGYKSDESIVTEFEVMVANIREEVQNIKKNITLAVKNYNSKFVDRPLSLEELSKPLDKHI